MSLFEIKVEIPPDSAESTNDVLLEQEAGNWSILEDAIARRAWIVGIFTGEKEAAAGWAWLSGLLHNLASQAAQVRKLPDTEWRDSYKAHFKAWHFGRLHWVPVWERETFKLPAGDAVLWLDPGMAFGTGNHETTRLVVERLVALAAPAPQSLDTGSKFLGKYRESPGGQYLGTGNQEPGIRRRSVLDAGCGSGILALSAAKLGFRDVSGFDIDPEAVRVSRENARLNRLDREVRFFVADVAKGCRGRKADVVVANIQSDILIRHARDLVRAVRPGGRLILSGILAKETAAVRRAFSGVASKWKSSSRRLGEWADMQLESPP